MHSMIVFSKPPESFEKDKGFERLAAKNSIPLFFERLFYSSIGIFRIRYLCLLFKPSIEM